VIFRVGLANPEITSMKTIVAAATRWCLMFLFPVVAYAGSAQWVLIQAQAT
jgi:hypothetical protein